MGAAVVVAPAEPGMHKCWAAGRPGAVDSGLGAPSSPSTATTRPRRSHCNFKGSIWVGDEGAIPPSRGHAPLHPLTHPLPTSCPVCQGLPSWPHTLELKNCTPHDPPRSPPRPRKKFSLGVGTPPPYLTPAATVGAARGARRQHQPPPTPLQQLQQPPPIHLGDSHSCREWVGGVGGAWPHAPPRSRV